MSTVKDAIISRLNQVIGQQNEELANLRMQLENVQIQLRGPAAPALDCISYITIKLQSNGSLQTSGNIGDLQHALSMLDNARDAINAQHQSITSPLVAPDGNPMVSVPNRDVCVKENTFSTRPFGDMQPGDRGDLPPS